jgi:hypothetical protein
MAAVRQHNDEAQAVIEVQNFFHHLGRDLKGTRVDILYI